MFSVCVSVSPLMASKVMTSSPTVSVGTGVVAVPLSVTTMLSVPGVASVTVAV